MYIQDVQLGLNFRQTTNFFSTSTFHANWEILYLPKKSHWIIVLSISMFQILRGTHLHGKIICCLSKAQTELHLLHLICQLGSYVKSSIIQVQIKSHTFREMSSYLSYFEGICAFIHHPMPINKYVLNTYFSPGTVLGSVAKRQRVARRQAIMTQENKCHRKRSPGYGNSPHESLSRTAGCPSLF